MSRFVRVLRELVADFSAASHAAAAVRRHQMPSDATLRQLGISPRDMATIRL